MTKKFNLFIFTFFIALISSLLIVSAFNFIYDPGEIYLKKILKDKYLDRYVSLVLNSSTGLSAFSNERIVKQKMAQKSNISSFIIGSSRTMQISSKNKPSSICGLTGDLTNLGVSGGSFEDLTIFSGILSENPNVKRIICGIDPWTFKFNMDSRWGIFQEDYQEYSWKFGFGSEVPKPKESYFLKILKNIINKEYLLKSWDIARRDNFHFAPNNQYEKLMKPVENFDLRKGAAMPVTLSDGSHVYDAEFIKKSKQFQPSKSQVGLGSYKIEGDYFDPKAEEFFGEIIDNLRNRGIEVYILMTPYHPAVFNEGNESIYKYLIEVELEVRRFANSKGIKCFGSYDPRKIGCLENEFFDDMHPNMDALNRINFS